MLSRVVRPQDTTYSESYTRKNADRIRGVNLNTKITTGQHFRDTPASLYGSDFSSSCNTFRYSRPRSAKVDLVQLPKEYNSTVRPNLDTNTPTTNYRTFYGTLGEKASIKHNAITSRNLSKQTRAEIEGTSRATHHPPGYSATIPREWKGNTGKYTHPDRSVEDLTWQFHPMKTGYGGYVPACNMTMNQHTPTKRASTTYREMCDEIGYRVND